MATDHTRQWIKFFTGCGIPEDIATSYSLIFIENRIQRNMLLDLNKEYLRDMGITVMGDIIAILRHAKVVHDKYIREQILSESNEDATVDNYVKNDESIDIKKSTPMKRMLEHYTRKYDSSDLNMPSEKVEIHIENDNRLVNVPKKLAHRIGVKNNVAVKKKIEAPSMRSDNLKPGKVLMSKSKILPENSESYTVKMPSGTTERSKKILERAKLKQSKTVFDRLGESSVSSSVPDDTTLSCTASVITKATAIKEKNISSVFSRLGEKSPLVTSTSSNGDSEIDELPYRGILKIRAGRKKVRFTPNSTMRADNELRLDNAKTKINILKERLGGTGKSTEASPAKENIKLNRLQITTTFEEDDSEPCQVQTLSTRFKSMATLSSEVSTEKKNILDGLGSYRSETIRNKAKVTSTTQLPEMKRGVKRRLQVSGSVDVDTTEVAQSKKVRFGRTTHRLIPGNMAEPPPPSKEYRNLTMTLGNDKMETKKFSAGGKIGPMKSDEVRQRLSLKDRIGGGLMKSESFAEEKRKRSLQTANRLKNKPNSILDRLE